MNREFKFRAWENGEMFYQVRVGGMFDEIATSPTFWSGKRKDWVNLTGGEYTKVMQYTGLKDKNGKEIYEGDIITCDIYPFKDNGKPNYNAEVYWDDDSLQFCILFHCVNPLKRGISDGMCEPLTDRVDDISECQFEIIGNIYENPNLLEVKS